MRSHEKSLCSALSTSRWWFQSRTSQVTSKLHGIDALTLGPFLICLGDRVLLMKIDIFLDRRGNILLKDFTSYTKSPNVYPHTDELCVLKCGIKSKAGFTKGMLTSALPTQPLHLRYVVPKDPRFRKMGLKTTYFATINFFCVGCVYVNSINMVPVKRS